MVDIFKVENLHTDILIIGAGAAGMVASISAARCFNNKNYKILLLEKNSKIGKKILVTGNGKCNISNNKLESIFYYSSNNNLIDKFLCVFNNNYLKKFFYSIGIEIKSDDKGRLYPANYQALSVKELLENEINRLKIDIRCEININRIKKDRNWFIINCDNFTVRSKCVIICTGGYASPFKGYNGDGYSYLREFGHSINEVFPALVPIKCDDKTLKLLKGVRWKSNVKLFADGKVIKEEYGEVQFLEKGLSGICVFQLSRLVSEFIFTGKIYNQKINNVIIKLDLLPEFEIVSLKKFIIKKINLLKNTTIENFLWGFLNKNIGQAILKRLNISQSKECSKLSLKEIDLIVMMIKNFSFVPSGVMDWKSAQVTAGGVPIEEVDVNTFESRITNGLYIAGEVLDVDGICGGYNLHWAWGSGIIAGKSAAKKIIKMGSMKDVEDI